MHNLYFLTEAPLITQDTDIHNTSCSILLHDTMAADIYQTLYYPAITDSFTTGQILPDSFSLKPQKLYQETVLTYFFVYFFIIFHFSKIHIIYQQSFAHWKFTLRQSAQHTLVLAVSNEKEKEN